MKIVLFFCSLALVIASQQWEDYKFTYGKSYSNAKEDLYRKTVFERNLEFITDHNERFENGEVTFKVAMNQFGDMTNEEFVAQMNGMKRQKDKKERKLASFPDVKRADTVDWVEKGGVTEVQAQGPCVAAGWAFATTGVVEGAHFVLTGDLDALSEQQLLDCSTENRGCDGGDVELAIDYIKSANGITSEKVYPYEGQVGKWCLYSPLKALVVVKEFVHIPSGDEVTQAAAVHDYGPVSAGIDAGLESFQFYASGVYYDPECDPEALNHTVLIVGYGTESDEDYWLIKNSWGISWGMDGYMKIARNKENHCGIASDSGYAIA